MSVISWYKYRQDGSRSLGREVVDRAGSLVDAGGAQVRDLDERLERLGESRVLGMVVDLGSVPAWIGAGAACFAAGTGFYGVFNGVRTYRRSVADAEANEMYRAREQARFVHAHVPKPPKLLTTGGVTLAGSIEVSDDCVSTSGGAKRVIKPLAVFHVLLDNASGEVISNVTLGLQYAGEMLFPLTWRPYVLAGQHVDIRIALELTDEVRERLTDIDASVTFNDGVGRIWTRDAGQPALDWTH